MTQPRILLVEDDPISARLSTNLLAELEAEIVHVLTGEEAVELFEAATPFDLVLMDLYLPAMSGFKATEAIRASAHYESRPIPIIAVSSTALMEDKAKFLKSTGFTDYINKPPRKDTFAAQVKKHLSTPHKPTTLAWY